MNVIVEGIEKTYRKLNVTVNPIKTIRAIKGKYCHVPVSSYIGEDGKVMARIVSKVSEDSSTITYEDKVYEDLSENQVKIVKLVCELEELLRAEDNNLKEDTEEA